MLKLQEMMLEHFIILYYICDVKTTNSASGNPV